MNTDKRIGFGHCIPNKSVKYVNTKYGDFPLGSPVSFHLQPRGQFLSIYSQYDNFHILSSITKSIGNSIIKSSVSESACNLPVDF